MLNSAIRTANWYLTYYVDFVARCWDEITFWQYIGLMMATLVVGYFCMNKGASGRR